MRLRGSITVEAALVMPIVIMVILFLIYLGFYEYDRAAGQSGMFFITRKGVIDEKEFDENKTVNAINSIITIYYGFTYTDGDSKITTGINGNIKIPLVGLHLDIKIRQSVSKCYAPQLLLSLKYAKEVKNALLKEDN